MDDFTKRFIKNNHFKVKKDSYQKGFYNIIFGTDNHNSIIRCHKEHIPQLIDLLSINMNEKEGGNKDDNDKQRKCNTRVWKW